MTQTEILYNGRCPICSAEIRHYERRAARTGAPLAFIDLHRAGLNEWALSEDAAKRRLHARLPDGTQVSGIEAFTAIWDNLPGFRWLARVMRLPLLRPLATFAYDGIAAPLLYRLHKRRERLGKAAPRT